MTEERQPDDDAAFDLREISRASLSVSRFVKRPCAVGPVLRSLLACARRGQAS
jgi:hypothetical protein